MLIMQYSATISPHLGNILFNTQQLQIWLANNYYNADLFPAGLDFTGVQGDVVPISSPSTQYTYTLIDDQIDEMQEMFNLILSAAGGSTVAAARAVATVTIDDDDREFKMAALCFTN